MTRRRLAVPGGGAAAMAHERRSPIAPNRNEYDLYAEDAFSF
jgi:hypothetical protein